ncbi:RAPTOR [Lepeophtheirus salmonis]|uniref:Ubiquitin-related modifier 1 homolog n=1 Tax=Lepeophtheirus salmonis TaxID=72036 RepID=A0A7R8H8J5_LEPSM|nr:RAPTOR [Lepeophtheirus salmonis]CAF2941010.1 RAPTOR [Lepeophtheirus salmonis]
MSTTCCLNLEFSGGAESLLNSSYSEKRGIFGVEVEISSDSVGSGITLADLLLWIKKNLLIEEKVSLFLRKGTVRPGILVLINQEDWELCEKEETLLKSQDQISFISTLHVLSHSKSSNFKMEATTLLENEDYPLAFIRPRHKMRISKEDESQDSSSTAATPWRLLERMKTVSVALVVCLNVGVDPPDVTKTSPCACIEAWIDPTLLNPTRALNLIGSALLRQYERWQPRARYRQSLDPTVDEVRRLAMALRKKTLGMKEFFFIIMVMGSRNQRQTERFWVFNRNYTQYIPLSLYDLQTWMGSPSIFFARQHEKEYMEQVNSQGINSSSIPAPPGSPRNCIQLAACSANELLPMNPELPADLFTSCLTTPVKIFLRWFILQNKGKITPNVTLDMLDKIPGQLNDRRTMLGELNWIFTAITDTIAWNTLSRDLFQKLFRQDLLVASLFRNFLLAERIMRSYDCTPVSQPKLPPTHQHPMWQAWDLAVDMSLSQLPGIIDQKKSYVSSSFFEEQQLTAFQVWLKYGRDNRKPPEQLPIVLQVLLSQDHRLRALDLLSRFLDLGPWAVNLALCVGIFPYVLRLLQSSARELRPLLVSIWTKILAVDSSCQADLARENCHNYFLLVLKDPIMMPEHRTGAAFVLASMVYNYKIGQRQAEHGNLISICLEQLDDHEPVLRQWLAIALGRVWDNHEPAKWRGARDNVHERLYELLNDPFPEVRTAAVFALGTFIHSTNDYTPNTHAESLDHKIALYLLNTVAEDASPMVRMELVVAIQWLVYAFEVNFINVIKGEKQQNAAVNKMPQTSNTLTPNMKRVSRIQASASSPSLDRLVQQTSKVSITSSTPSAISSYGGVYCKIYAGLVSLSIDPFDDVASMANQLLQYLKCRELSATPIMQSSICEGKSSSSVPSSPANSNNSFLSAAKLESKAPSSSRKVKRRSSGEGVAGVDVIAGSNNYNTLPRNGRQHHPPATPNSLQHLDLLSSSPTNTSMTTLVEKPCLSTEFVEWSSTYFSNELMKSDCTNTEPDLESPYHWERDWLNKRNDSIRFKASEQSQKFTYGVRNGNGGKIEEQLSVIRFSEPAYSLKFHPFNNYLAVGSKSIVNIYDIGTGAKVSSLSFSQNKSSRVTAIEYINAHEKAMLIAGSDDGSVRIWRDFDVEPALVTAWFAMPDLCSTTSKRVTGPLYGSKHGNSNGNNGGIKICWESVNRCLIAGGGDSRAIRLWDAEKELKIHEWTVSPETYVTHISCTDSTPWVYAVGFSDGSIRIMDKRLSTSCTQIYPGAGDGIIRFYEPRALSSCRTVQISDGGPRASGGNHSISSLSIHERAQIAASWTSSQVCSIHSLLSNGPQINAIKYYDGILGQRLVNVKSLQFHPHLMTLGVYARGASTTDSSITSFGTTNGSNNLKTSIKSTEKSESELLKSNILSSTTSVTPIEMEEKIIRIGLNDRKLSLKSVGTELQEKHVFPNIKSYSRRNSSITCTDDATTMTLVDKEALVNSENSSIIQLHTKNGTRRGSVDRKSSSKQTKNKDLESVKNNILPYTRPLCEINSSINHINTKPTVGLTNGRTSVNSIYSETSKKDSLSSIKPLSRRNSSIIQIDAEHADRKTSANLIDSESLKGDLLLPLHRRNSVVIEIDAETTSGLVNRKKKSSKSVDSKRETLSPKKIHSRRNSSIDEVSKIVVDASVSKIDNILQLSSVSQNKKIPSRRNSTIEIFQKFIGIDSQSKSDRNEYVLTIDDVPRTSIPTEENKPVHLGINLSDTGENQRKSDILDYKFKEPSSSSKDEKDHTNYKEIKKDVIIRSQKSDLETDVLSEVKKPNIINNNSTNIEDTFDSSIMGLECEKFKNTLTLSVDNEDSSFNTTKTTENTDSLSRESSMKVSRETSKLMEDNHHNKKLSIARRKSLKIIELSDGKSSSKKRSKSFDSIGSESTAHLSVPPIEALSEVNVLPNERSISLIPVNKEPENNDSIETVKSEVQKMLNQKVSKNDKLDLLQSLLASLANEDDFESSEIPNSDLVQPSRMENVNQRTYPPITEVGEELPNLEQTASEKSDHQIQNESHNSDGTVMKSLVVESKSDQEEERIDNLQTQYSIIESSQELTDKTANVKELEVLETDETSIVEKKKVRDESNVDDDESSSDCDDILDSNETPLVLNLEKMELSPKKYSQYEVGSNSSNSLEGSEIESSEEEEYVSEFGLVTDDDTGSNVEKNVQTDNEVKENVFQDDGSDREESLESEYELESFDSENEREKEEELESEYEIEEEEELECEYVLEEEEDLESEYEFEEEEELESEHKSKEEEELKSEHKSKEEEKLESEHYSKEEDELESEHKSMDEEELEFENKFEEEEELESEHKSEEEEELESEHKSEEEEELEFNHEPEQVVLDEDNRGDDQADKVSLIIDVKSLTPKEDSISELDESLEHDISSSLEKALESIETLKVLQKRLSIDLESINVKKSLIDAETVKTERLENDGNLINVNYGINVSELEQCSKSSPIVDQGSRAVEGGITQDLVVVDKEVILVKDKELFVEKNSDSLENIMENKGIHLSDSKTFIEEDKHKLEIQLFSNNGNKDETKKALDKILHLMEKLARRSSLLSEENRRKNVNTPLKEDIQDNRRCSSSMSMHEESQVLQVIKTIDREIHSSSRKQSIISNTSSKSNIIEIIGDVEEVIQEKGEYEERLSLRSSLSPDHQLSDGKNVSPISDTMEIDCQVSKEDAFLNEKEKNIIESLQIIFSGD